MAADSQFTPLVHRLGCLREISTLTGFALAVEIGDWHRFTGNTIGTFVGLVPSEYSSGASRAPGPITKTGNTHACRLLVQALHSCLAPPHPLPDRSRHAGPRWNQAPARPAREEIWATGALHDRWIGFLRRKKRPVVTNVAIARELAGWCWSLAVLDT